MPPDIQRFCVLAAGTWGVGLAHLLASNGLQGRLWDPAPKLAEHIENSRQHPKFPKIILPPSLHFGHHLPWALKGADLVVCVTPAIYFRSACEAVLKAGYHNQPFVICTKGIEAESLLLMHEIARQVLGNEAALAVLSGPSHAEEVICNMPTAVSIAANCQTFAEKMQACFINPNFRVYTQTDVLGVELGAALKNIVAIACGMSDGLGFGDNAKAGLMTRGLGEIVRLGVQMGAKASTLYGLSGMGDLVVTCMSSHSRNNRFGYLMGQGLNIQEAQQKIGMVVEGFYTVEAAVTLAKKHHVDMPIAHFIHAIKHGMAVQDAFQALMQRQATSEG